ncbi:hypothetical protein QBC45DRAFT_60260 [Copromyces sp. CBS 386.78]|nr:hypothetical protein QBC45DRAFT_60260 [Copromyces sp. CBS 386.78]
MNRTRFKRKFLSHISIRPRSRSLRALHKPLQFPNKTLPISDRSVPPVEDTDVQYAATEGRGSKNGDMGGRKRRDGNGKGPRAAGAVLTGGGQKAA